MTGEEFGVKLEKHFAAVKSKHPERYADMRRFWDAWVDDEVVISKSITDDYFAMLGGYMSIDELVAKHAAKGGAA